MTESANIARIRRIKGQVEGIERMIEQKADCLSIVQQILAAKNALSGLAAEILYQESCELKSQAKLKKLLGKLVKEE